jgi:hypothetical protein
MNKALTIAAAIAALLLTTLGADARHRHQQNKPQGRVIYDVAAIPAYQADDRYPTQSLSRPMGHRPHTQAVRGYDMADANGNYSRHYGACDGFHRCRCGTTAARHFGLSYAHNGMNLKKASSWYGFPHTSFHIGAAGVAPHHVLAIVGGSDCRNATVSDDAGTYQRSVCGMTFVEPNGGNYATNEVSAHRSHRHHHRRYAAG